MISNIFHKFNRNINYIPIMSNINILGSFYPSTETYQIEFKEFWLKYNPCLLMNKKSIKNIINTGII